jgi:hypothetical protein
MTPRDGADRTGVQSISVDVTYRDTSHVTTRVFIGAELIGSADRSCRDGECTGHLDWDTTTWPPGYHDLTVALEDAAGNITHVTNEILVDDVLSINAMEIANVFDGGSLEIEVYAFDESRTMLGCAGSRHGLNIVDNSAITYAPTATLITTDSRAFGTLAAAGGRFALEVWEDDDEPVCPAPLAEQYNDLVAATPYMRVDEWRTVPTLSYTNVPLLGTTWGRPLREGEIVDPPLPRPDPWFDGDASNGGCSAGGPASGLFVVAGFLPLIRRRRRLRAS